MMIKLDYQFSRRFQMETETGFGFQLIKFSSGNPENHYWGLVFNCQILMCFDESTLIENLYQVRQLDFNALDKAKLSTNIEVSNIEVFDLHQFKDFAWNKYFRELVPKSPDFEFKDVEINSKYFVRISPYPILGDLRFDYSEKKLWYGSVLIPLHDYNEKVNSGIEWDKWYGMMCPLSPNEATLFKYTGDFPLSGFELIDQKKRSQLHLVDSWNLFEYQFAVNMEYIDPNELD